MLAALFDLCLLLGLWFSAAALSLLLAPRVRAAASDVLRNAMARDWIFRGIAPAGLLSAGAALFGLTWVYFVAAEIITGGRSPGKRALGLRVVHVKGAPIGPLGAMLRNLVRLVDMLPGSYGVGLVAAVASGKSQRLGDLCARAVVVREAAARPAGGPAVPGRLLAALGADELLLVSGFWARGPLLAPAVRGRLARQIAPVLRARLADKSSLDDESFLWALLHEANDAPSR